MISNKSIHGMISNKSITHRCIYCGMRYRLPETCKSDTLMCDSTVCNLIGNFSLVPYTELSDVPQSWIVKLPVTDKLISRSETDMCVENKRWMLNIEQSSAGYNVRVSHRDKNRSDDFTRTFDTFEEALQFANDTYDDLK